MLDAEAEVAGGGAGGGQQRHAAGGGPGRGRLPPHHLGLHLLQKRPQELVRVLCAGVQGVPRRIDIIRGMPGCHRSLRNEAINFAYWHDQELLGRRSVVLHDISPLDGSRKHLARHAEMKTACAPSRSGPKQLALAQRSRGITFGEA